MIQAPVRRVLCPLLSICLIVSAVGCRSGAERAEEKAGRLKVGMTRAEVEGALGAPDDRSYRAGINSLEVWTYSYSVGFDPRPDKVIFGLILAGVVIVVIAGLAYIACKGGGSFPNFPGGASNGNDRAAIEVTFDPESGKVARVVIR